MVEVAGAGAAFLIGVGAPNVKLVVGLDSPRVEAAGALEAEKLGTTMRGLTGAEEDTAESVEETAGTVIARAGADVAAGAAAVVTTA